ncbi:hypothetical protein CORC01_07074 [Colletotrichum orchidophilum]|uniref:Uncharacterized protein n=1 Tax=Colletotrichum orchidophilum TaxID=1209926 RepID=A0A1G4B887_9PEZI|nr:uncharacterized protein CORC01_07074 [Colletotrichum orchidophilum]OHE97659.1 hypothetical protein CORC01_07074 [Colletotrichum orchidophilum]
MPSLNFSPYAPRRRRSPRIVITWVAAWLTVLTLTWWIVTRRSSGLAGGLERLAEADAVIKGKEVPPEAGA